MSSLYLPAFYCKRLQIRDKKNVTFYQTLRIPHQRQRFYMYILANFPIFSSGNIVLFLYFFTICDDRKPFFCASLSNLKPKTEPKNHVFIHFA